MREKKFKGRLTLETIAEGIKLSLENAEDLVEDATVLLQAGRFGRALALSVSALEELGKVRVLKTMVRIPPRNQKLWAEAWQSFPSHGDKAVHGSVDAIPDDLRVQPELMLQQVIAKYASVEIIEAARQKGLYVDFSSSQKKWLSPKEVTKEDARKANDEARHALEHQKAASSLGLLDLKALRIEHEVLAPLNEDRPLRKDLTTQHIDAMRRQLRRKMQEYCRRLVDAGVLQLDDDVQFFGLSLADFLDEDC